jgi:hypothetical protein
MGAGTIVKAIIKARRSRKPVSEMTPEEHEAHKAWQREDIKRRKLAQDPEYTPRGSPKRLLSAEDAAAQEGAYKARQAAGKKAAMQDPAKRDAARESARKSHQKNLAERKKKQAEYRKRNAEKLKKKRDGKYQDPAEREKLKERSRESARRNRAAINARNAAARKKRLAEDPEGERQRQREAAIKHRDKDPVRFRAKKAADASKRRTRAFTPPHADVDQIQEIHHIAGKVRDLTQMPWEVDHVIPYQGRKVTGFNHPDNLLIIPREQNRSKGAVFSPGNLPDAGGVQAARSLLEEILKSQGR